jgi:hypothetical protein
MVDEADRLKRKNILDQTTNDMRVNITLQTVRQQLCPDKRVNTSKLRRTDHINYTGPSNSSVGHQTNLWAP